MGAIKILNSFRSKPMGALGKVGIGFSMPVNIRDFLSQSDISSDINLDSMLLENLFRVGGDGFTFLTRGLNDTYSQVVVLEDPNSEASILPVGWAFKTAMLQDGRVVIGGYDDGTGANLVYCFAAGTTNIVWTHHTPDYVLSDYIDIDVLKNGNIVLTWVDYGDDYVYFKIIDPAGNEVVTETDVSEDTAAGNGNFVLALADGGFAICFKYSTETYISIYNADGTIRVSAFEVPPDFLSGSGSDSPLAQFDNGNIITFSAFYDEAIPAHPYRSYTFDPTTGAAVDNAVYSEYINQGAAVHAAHFSSADKFALVWSASDHIYGGVINADQSMLIYDKLILSNSYPDDLLAISGGRFLMQVEANYYILNENLDIISGPTVAFTEGNGRAVRAKGSFIQRQNKFNLVSDITR